MPPYSVDEIYGLREGDGSGKYRVPKRIYNEMYRIFGTLPPIKSSPDIIVAEDSILEEIKDQNGNMMFPSAVYSK